MDIAAIGSLLGGAGQAAGGIAGLFGGGARDMTAVNQSFAQNQFNANMAMQKEFAQNGIRWRVADAKAAGLHPLAAVGAAGASFSPVISSGGDSGGTPNRDIGASLANMGQGIGRAVAATQSPQEKVLTAFEIARQAQQLEHGGLQNDVLRAQLASTLALNNTSSGPGMPGNVGQFEIKPAQVTSSQVGNPVNEAGPAQPGNRIVAMPGGHFVPLPAQSLNIDELTSPGGLTWQMTNRLLPLVDQTARNQSKPPLSDLPKGAHDWQFTMLGWRPVYHRDFLNRSNNQPPFAHLPRRPSDYPYTRRSHVPSGRQGDY